MSVDGYLAEAYVRHQIYLLRYAGGVSNDIKDIIDEIYEELKKSLESGDNIVQITRKARELLEQEEAKRLLADSMRQLNEAEINYTDRILSRVIRPGISTVNADAIFAATSNKQMVLTSSSGAITRLTDSEAVDKLVSSASGRTLTTIRAGFVDGLSNAEIARSLKRDQVISKSEAESLTRTLTNHYATQARAAVHEANKEYLLGEEFLATLDHKTSFICAKFDGKIFKVNQGPMPVLHYRCRSTRSPKVKPEFQIPGFVGNRPSIGSGGVKVVSRQTKFNSFLKNQSKEFQDDYLGPTRAKLFRAGKFRVDEFTDPGGRTYTIKELIQQED
jgi:SPP1 gp7 family putative phage head morphogenesis protein